MMRNPGVEGHAYPRPQKFFVGDVVRQRENHGDVGLVKEVRLLLYGARTGRDHSYWRIGVHFFSLSNLVDCAPSDLELISRAKRGSVQ